MDKKENSIERADYVFGRIPVKLAYALGNNGKIVLMTLINMRIDHEWFNASMSRISQLCGLSEEVVRASLETLYRANVIFIKTEGEGRRVDEDMNEYKVNIDKFIEYDALSIDECMDKFHRIPDLIYSPKGGKRLKLTYLEGCRVNDADTTAEETSSEKAPENSDHNGYSVESIVSQSEAAAEAQDEKSTHQIEIFNNCIDSFRDSELPYEEKVESAHVAVEMIKACESLRNEEYLNLLFDEFVAMSELYDATNADNEFNKLADFAKRVFDAA